MPSWKDMWECVWFCWAALFVFAIAVAPFAIAGYVAFKLLELE